MSMERFSLKGKAAIVAGGGRGIGEAVSMMLADAGAAVAVVDIVPERARGVAEAIKAVGGTALPVMADVFKADAVDAMVNETRRTFGGVDILVNNTGGIAGYIQFRRMTEWTEEEWDMMMNMNLRYVFLTCRAVIKAMMEQGRGGSIVNISSISGIVSAPNHAAYGAAKGGLLTLTRTLAVEYASHGIRVNSVAPGSIITPVTAVTRTPNDAEAYKSSIPLGKAGEPEDIARAVLFFASDMARYVTGQWLLVDGGAYAKFPLDHPGSPTHVGT